MNDCRKNLDAKSNACIMMSYAKELKAYRMFDLVKQHIIIRCNVIFEEKASSLGLLKTTSGSSYNDLFGIVKDTRLTVPFKGISTSLSTSVLEFDW